MTKNARRRDRFQNITDAIDSIRKEAEWRHRKEDHEFAIRPNVLQAKELTSRTAGGPVMKVTQFESTTRGLRGMSLIIDRLSELQQVEQRNLAQ